MDHARKLRDMATYCRTLARTEPQDEYDIDRIAEAMAMEAGATALDRLAALERELAEARKDGARLRWWFTEGHARQNQREEIRAKRERSKKDWTPERWIKAIDASMGGE